MGLHRACTAAQIRAAYRSLAKRHHPDLQPESVDATRQAQAINEAHAILSDPTRRRAYDRDLREAERPAGRPRGERIQRNVSQDVRLRIEELLRGTTMSVTVKDPAELGRTETYQLIVPAMTPPGSRFRLLRADSVGGGFIQLRIRVLPGVRFKVRGLDLRISPQRAIAGGSETVPGPSGTRLRVAIPAGVKRGEVLRVPGEGLPKPRGGRGDLLVRVTYPLAVRVSRTSRW